MDSLAYATGINQQSIPTREILGTTRATSLIWQEERPHRRKQTSRSLSATCWIWHGGVRFGSGQHQLWLWSWPWWWCNGTTTNVLNVPQEDLTPEAFDKEVKSPMVYDITTEEPAVLATPPTPTTSRYRSARRATLYAHANQDIKTCSIIIRQFIQNCCNHSSWVANSGPSRPIPWPKICTRLPPRHDTASNEGWHETMGRAIWGCCVAGVVPAKY